MANGEKIKADTKPKYESINKNEGKKVKSDRNS